MNTAQQIINEITASTGLSDSVIAKLVNTTQPTIWRIRTGVTEDCGAKLYMDLLALHTKQAARKRKAA